MNTSEMVVAASRLDDAAEVQAAARHLASTFVLSTFDVETVDFLQQCANASFHSLG